MKRSTACSGRLRGVWLEPLRRLLPPTLHTCISDVASGTHLPCRITCQTVVARPLVAVSTPILTPTSPFCFLSALMPSHHTTSPAPSFPLSTRFPLRGARDDPLSAVHDIPANEVHLSPPTSLPSFSSQSSLVLLPLAKCRVLDAHALHLFSWQPFSLPGGLLAQPASCN